MKYAAMRHVTLDELTHRSAAADWYPSEVLHEHEVGLITHLARDVASARRRFKGWPVITLDSRAEPYYGRSIVMRAEVGTIPDA